MLNVLNTLNTHTLLFPPDDSRFSIDELFDELALISFETAEEQAQLEAEFWNITLMITQATVTK